MMAILGPGADKNIRTKIEWVFVQSFMGIHIQLNLINKEWKNVIPFNHQLPYHYSDLPDALGNKRLILINGFV
jgi:hypothetical protein